MSIYDKPLPIYIAASFSEQDRMRRVRAAIQGMGHTVTSRWLDEDPNLVYDHWEDLDAFYRSLYAGEPKAMTLSRHLNEVMQEDLHNSRAMVWFPGGKGAGGKMVEYGLAIGLGLYIVVIGHVETPMQVTKDAVIIPDTYAGLADALDRIRKEVCRDADPAWDIGYGERLVGCE